MNMTEEEYEAESGNYAGYCQACDDITADGVEPDAQGYKCPKCGQMQVMGLENALLAGHINLGDES